MENAERMRNNWVEPNYLDVLGIKMIAGSAFSETRDSLSEFNVIINQEAAKQFGMTPGQAVGDSFLRSGKVTGLHFMWWASWMTTTRKH